MEVEEGRPDLGERGELVYVDPGERELPVVFPPERIHLEDALHRTGANLIDPEWGLSGRPDMVVRTPEVGLVPVEYKATHLFVGYHSPHGRTFDVIQSIAQCRLVQAVTGTRPAYGIVWYGDAAGEGAREGWLTIPYDEKRQRWLRLALDQVRDDRLRAPVPNDRNCPHCEAHREQLCSWAVGTYDGPHR